ncbi:MAG: pyrroline-5-carboxylate reductase [Chloroflexota bacterium]
MFNDKLIAFIGGGAMGSAIIRGMIANMLVDPNQIVVSDTALGLKERLNDELGVQVAPDNLTAVKNADVVVLAIKPQGLPYLLPELNGRLAADSLVISIIAGAPIATFQAGLGHNAIVRSMPNTPAQVGEGMTVWTQTEAVSDEQAQQAQAIFGAYGAELKVEQEKYLDMSTAINGSGPAYVFLFLEAMIDAGVHMGLPRPIAEKLVNQTVFGSTKYAIESDKHLAQLKNQVTSPGGTTAAGLFELEAGKLRHTVANGVWAAYKRSVELGKKG